MEYFAFNVKFHGIIGNHAIKIENNFMKIRLKKREHISALYVKTMLRKQKDTIIYIVINADPSAICAAYLQTIRFMIWICRIFLDVNFSIE